MKSKGFHNCDGRPSYTAWGKAEMIASLGLNVGNPPPSGQVAVNYNYSVTSRVTSGSPPFWFDWEGGIPDPVYVQNPTFTMNGGSLIDPALMTLVNVIDVKNYRDSGHLAMSTANTFTMATSADTRAEVNLGQLEFPIFKV